jgi:hypothetical protein
MNPEFEAKWGCVYEDYKAGSQISIMSEFLFCVRRIVFLWTVFGLREHPSY